MWLLRWLIIPARRGEEMEMTDQEYRRITGDDDYRMPEQIVVERLGAELDRQRKTMGEVADELDQIALTVREWLSRPTLAATLARLAERLRISGEPGSPDPPRHTPAPPPPGTQRSA